MKGLKWNRTVGEISGNFPCLIDGIWRISLKEKQTHNVSYYFAKKIHV